MPNWVTNKIQAPEHVIRAMLNADGRIDFNTMAPFAGPNNWDGICCDAEQAAEIACGIPVNGHPLIASIETRNRAGNDIRKLRDESFRQFIGMLENYRACGYLHNMAFARDVWGTKWNAYEPDASPEQGVAQFDTAWSCPDGVLIKLSERFPDDLIRVTYADEDTGSNCGTFSLKAGAIVEQNIAPSYSTQSPDERAKWKAFACDIKGYDPEEDEE